MAFYSFTFRAFNFFRFAKISGFYYLDKYNITFRRIFFFCIHIWYKKVKVHGDKGHIS